ncbi:MAG: DNA repair protein RecN [Muribaculaceae bacterium]|nr:DNA repair protein RecN [Muribaculaceae bacterium]
MLRNLEIWNYALIERLELEFGPGLTIITGETGAGKSIMLGALGLVMGGRSDTKVIADTGSKSVVSATFTDVDPELRTLLEERGIDWLENETGESELTVRRELSASGRSKIYVNDRAVTLQTLQTIVPRLIDIHSQHANTKINNPAERLKIIDELAANAELRKKYREAYDAYVALRRRIIKIREQREQSVRNLDFLTFQLSLLDKLQPKIGELTEIERKFEILSDAAETREQLAKLIGLLSDQGAGVGMLLSEAIQTLDRTPIVAEISQSDGPSISERLRRIAIETKDIAETIDEVFASVDSDPAAADKLSARMNAYYEAIKHFKVKEADELVAIHDSLKIQVTNAGGNSSDLTELERQSHQLAKQLKEVAENLTESRIKSAEKFSEDLRQKAYPLGLPNIQFEARINKKKLSSDGQDEVEFLCSFNKNGKHQPESEIASGGEISRMMLSLKAIMAGHINLPTIIFDEVDTGVSGEIADKMGSMMRDISADMQVIVITHLPQVAAKGSRHFKVFKKDCDTRTVTHVRELDLDGRVRELATMISGSEVTDAALKAARSLLKL